MEGEIHESMGKYIASNKPQVIEAILQLFFSSFPTIKFIVAKIIYERKCLQHNSTHKTEKK